MNNNLHKILTAFVFAILLLAGTTGCGGSHSADDHEHGADTHTHEASAMVADTASTYVDTTSIDLNQEHDSDHEHGPDTHSHDDDTPGHE